MTDGQQFRSRVEAVLGGHGATTRLAKATGYDRSSIQAMYSGHRDQKPAAALVAVIELLEKLPPDAWPDRWRP